MPRSRNTVVLVNHLPSVNSTFASKGCVYPSTALMLIGSLLKKHGFNVKVIDGGYYESYLAMLRDYITEHGENIIWLGMSVMTTQVPLALKTSQEAKRIDRRIPIVWGGTHPTLFPQQTLSNENVDIIAINEGALTALKLTRALQRGADLASLHGLAYKDADRGIVTTPCAPPDDIRDLPHFDFTLFDIDNYLDPVRNVSVYRREFPGFRGKVRLAPVLTGLGCPYKCQFCINVILERRYRFREAASIVEELKRLQAQYGVNTFVFMDEDFFASKRRLREFVSLVERENLHFNWRMWCRVDHLRDEYVDRALLTRLDRIGHGSLVMGGESGNQEVLDGLGKGITPDQTLRSLRMLDGTRIFPRYSFMVGLENETLGQIRDTYKFCLKMKDIRPDTDIAGPFIFRLYPGSPIYERLVERYDIEVPERLEEWGAFLARGEAAFTSTPWIPAKFREQHPCLQFYYGLATGSAVRIRGLRDVWRALAARVARFRVRHFCCHLPLGYWRDQRARLAQ